MSTSPYPSPEIITFGESMGLLTAKDTRGLEYAATLDKSFGVLRAIWLLAYHAWGIPVVGLDVWAMIRSAV